MKSKTDLQLAAGILPVRWPMCNACKGRPYYDSEKKELMQALQSLFENTLKGSLSLRRVWRIFIHRLRRS
jgi:hypothetical protein